MEIIDNTSGPAHDCKSASRLGPASCPSPKATGGELFFKDILHAIDTGSISAIDQCMRGAEGLLADV